MILNKHHIAILRRLALGTPGTIYGLARNLKLENALVSNLSQQLADVKLLRKAENDLLKITDAGQRVLQCIAKNESYDHLLPAEPSTAESSAEDINSLCTTKQPTSQAPQVADQELVQRVLRVLFKASKSIGISKTAEQVNANHIQTKAALDQLAEQGHLKKYSGGSYYITASGRLLVEQANLTESPAVDDTDEGQPGGTLEQVRQPEAQAADVTGGDEDLIELVDAKLAYGNGGKYRVTAEGLGIFGADIQPSSLKHVFVNADRFQLVSPDGESIDFKYPIHSEDPTSVITDFNLDQMAIEFEQEQSSQDHPVIDDINAKERALGYCSLLLSPHSTELKRAIEALQMDLAVIRLHQERRA